MGRTQAEALLGLVLVPFLCVCGPMCRHQPENMPGCPSSMHRGPLSTEQLGKPHPLCRAFERVCLSMKSSF